MTLFFTSIWFLILLPLALLPFFLRRGVRLCQSAVLLLLILAASGPVLRLTERGPECVALYEEGAVPDFSELKRRFPDSRTVPFHGSPAHALSEAGAALQKGGVIHLFSDFSESSGSIARETDALARRGIPVFAHFTPSAMPQAPVLSKFSVPLHIGTGETAEVEFSLFLPHPAPLRLVLRDESGAELARMERKFSSGVQSFTLPFSLSGAGERELIAEINGRRAGSHPLRVDAPLRALLISPRPEEDAAALNRMFASRLSVAQRTADSVFASYPLLIFGENGVNQLSRKELAEVAHLAERGTGLLLFTGRSPLFAPGSVPAEFEKILPLRPSGNALERTPTTALVIIIDTSGSMSGTRLALARETARLALDKLRDCDMAGIVEFHGRRRWAAPMQSASNHLELRRALNRLNAGGGTVILPAVEEAFYALRNVDTRLKHVLILTDGGVERGDFDGLLRRMAQSDITVSTVMVGPGQSDFLARLALLGGGRFYNAASRFALPELNFRQSGREALPPYREGVFRVERGVSVPFTERLPENLTVSGVSETEFMPGSVEFLRGGGLPLAAFRSCGLGTAAVIASELSGPWVRNLSADPAWTGMLAGLARALPDPVKSRRFDFRSLSMNRDVHIRIDSSSEHPELFVELRSGGGAERMRLVRGSDGAFHFRASGLAAGAYSLSVSEEPDFSNSESVRFLSADAPYTGSPEANRAFAEELNRRSALVPVPAEHENFLHLRPLFGFGFVILMLLQILLRRLPFRRSALVLCFAVLLPLSGQSADRFELAVQLEDARSAGTLPALLEKWKKNPDPDRLELLLNELEDSGRSAEALKLLENVPADARFAPRLLRLAEKCGKTELMRRRTREMMADDPNLFWLNAAVRLELLAGNRAEALHLFEMRIAKETNPEILFALSVSAESAALYSAASAALKKAETAGGEFRWRARFMEVELLRRKGEPEAALALLKKFAEENLPRGLSMKAADLCEQLGDIPSALQIYRRNGSEEALLRSAMLLESSGNAREARALWMRIWRESANEMRSRQAADRVIALAVKEKSPDKLLTELKHAPETPRRKLFYCRALAAAGRQDDVLRYLHDPADERMRLAFLLEFKRWREAAALLETLKEKYPAERESFLQQLTAIAVESRDRALAERSVSELLGNAKDRASALEYSAGVFALLGEHAKAAELYSECLKLAPDRIELYLLRANAEKASGKGADALRFFLTQIADPSLPPDLFGVMADGLLNLNAPKPALKQGLKAVLTRLESAPGELFYYRLAEDFAEELGDSALWRKLQLRQLAVAPERRVLLLRGLFEDSVARSDRAEALRYARILLGLNETCSPALSRALVQSLIESGNFSAAERCAGSADSADGSHQNLFALTEILLDSGHLMDSARICRELLSLSPDDPALLFRYAEVLEAQGNYREAGRMNWKALRLTAARGNYSAEFAKRLLPRIASFANQAVLFPELQAEVKTFSRTASPSARKAVWSPLLRRIAVLQSGRPTGKPRPVVPRIAPAAAFAEELRTFAPDAAAEKVKSHFDSMKPERRAAFWLKLVGGLRFEPSPVLSSALERIGDSLKTRDASVDWPLNSFALKLKRRYADAMLKRFPDSMHALTLAARLHMAGGETDTARTLAGEVYDLFLKQEQVKLPDLRILRDLNCVYADSPSAREEWIETLNEDRALLGDSLPHDLLLTVLLDGAGRSGEAFSLLAGVWKRGVRELTVFRTLEELAPRCGRLNEFRDLLLEYAPKDTVVQVLYARRLVFLLRTSGRGAEARAYLSALPQVLMKRERLLLDRESLAPEVFALELCRFVTDQSRTGSFVGFYADDYGASGTPRANVLPSLAAGLPSLRAPLEYLLCGMPVTERGFATLVETLRTLPPVPQNDFPRTAPVRVILKSLCGASLDAAERKLAEMLASDPRIPPENALLFRNAQRTSEHLKQPYSHNERNKK